MTKNVWVEKQPGPTHCCFICIVRGNMQACVSLPGLELWFDMQIHSSNN